MLETIEVGIGAAVWAEADPDLGEDVDLVGSSALRARKAATALLGLLTAVARRVSSCCETSLIGCAQRIPDERDGQLR